MGISQYLSKFALGVSSQGVLSAAKGGTGNTSGGGTAPTVSAIGYGGDDTATDPAGGSTITLTGTNFFAGAKVLIDLTQVSVVTVVSATQITFTAPAKTAGSYVLYVVNTDGSTAISVPGIQYSGVPAWSTSAGTLGTLTESTSLSTTVTATSNSTVTYSLFSGTLPTGSTIASNGTISGTTPITASSTTYTFTVRATDLENQDTDRSFSLTINPDVVTWSSPSTINLDQNTSSSSTLIATSAAGKSISYTVDSLPTGMTLSGSTVSGTPTVLGTTSTTATATAATTLKTANQTISWVVTASGDTYFKNTVLLLSGNGSNNAQNNTFIDSSTNNFTITRGGNTTQGTFSPYGNKWSNYFDGTGDYLVAPAGTAIMGTGDFTIELWVYHTAGGAWAGYYYQGEGGSGGGLNFRKNNLDQLSLSHDGVVDVFTTTATVPINQWVHIALTRSSGTIKSFINGILASTTTYATSFTGSAGQQTIGSITSGVYYLAGYISNFRVVKGTAVYTSAFTPTLAPLTAITGTEILTCQSNRIKDSSINNLNITRSGDVSVQRFSPFSLGTEYSTSTIGGSAYFDGSGNDYLSIPNSTNLNLGSSDFTIQGWWYPIASSDQNIIAKWWTGGNQWVVQWRAAGYFRFAVNSSTLSDFSVTLPLRSWCHFAFVRSGSNLNFYFNGVKNGATGTLGSITATTDITTIGQFANSGTENLSGYLSDMRVVIGTALYTATFTPPTAPLTAITNTQLLTNFTNAGIIDSTMLNNLETVGDAKISTTQSKFGGSSMYFDGTGDYLTFPSNSQYAFGTADFTVECWVNSADVSSAQKGFIQTSDVVGGLSTGYNTGITVLFGARQNGASASSLNGALLSNIAGTNIGSSTAVITSNTWTHIALVRITGTVTLYVNGVSVGSGTAAGNCTGTNLVVGGYYNGSYLYNGYLDDLRITKGYARYTANFTPTATAFAQK